MKRAILALLAATLLASSAHAIAPPAEAYVFAGAGAIDAQVLYFDGLSSTKITFGQFQGSTSSGDHRLVPGAVCTEWRGTFHSVVLMAGSEQNAQSATLRIEGAVGSTPGASGARDGPGWVVDAFAYGGALQGTLLVCDNPQGPGLIDVTLDVAPLPLNAPRSALVRVKEVG